jgi:hypothetical protein
MMMFPKLLIAAAIALQVQGEQILVNVGEGGNYFVHPNFPASVGDVVVFGFGGPGPQNHSVVQGTYSNPCFPLDGGFYSGFMPVAPGAQGGVRALIFRVPYSYDCHLLLILLSYGGSAYVD